VCLPEVRISVIDILERQQASMKGGNQSARMRASGIPPVTTLPDRAISDVDEDSKPTNKHWLLVTGELTTERQTTYANEQLRRRIKVKCE
jgi:hypothetical protein